MPDSQTKSENDLALAIADWLEADGWTVYEEVSPWGNNGRRADLVAQKGAIIWVIETKKCFNLDLLDQAASWLPYAHFVSIGIWRGKRNVSITARVCKKFHLGLITVGDYYPSLTRHSISEQIEGIFNRRARVEEIKRMLVEENRKSGNAGKPAHHFHTPFKMTVAALVKTVTDNPGITLEAALRNKHHYKNDQKAKTNLISALTGNRIAGIEYKIEGGQYRLYPAGFDAAGCAAKSCAVLPLETPRGEQKSLF